MSLGSLSYPTGPDPVCESEFSDSLDDLGTLVDPSCPRVNSLGAPLLWPVYGLTAGVPLLSLLFAAYRRCAGAARAPVVTADGLHVLPYRSSVLGRCGLVGAAAFYLQWIYLYVLILVDNYYDCQFGGINNLCFFGSYPLFGTSMRNELAFFVCWWCSLLAFLHLLWCADRLLDFFRLPCALDEATHLSILPPADECMHAVKSRPRWIVRRWQAAAAWAGGGAAAGGGGEKRVTVRVRRGEAVRYVEFRCCRYVLRGGTLDKVAPRLERESLGSLAARRRGVGAAAQAAALAELGTNRIAYEVDVLGAALAKEFLSLLYLHQFQLYIVWTWFGNFVTAAPLMALVVAVGALNVYLTRSAQARVATLANASSTCTVRRGGGAWVRVHSTELVPGDVVAVEGGRWVAPADLVLLRGAAIVDESSLTGESMPVRKRGLQTATEPAETAYDARRHAQHTILAGTAVLQIDPGAQATEGGGRAGDEAGAEAEEAEEAARCAVVAATGVGTSKGEMLVRIVFPQRMVFKYDAELPVAFALLFAYALVMIGVTTWVSIANEVKQTFTTLFVTALYSVTQVINPLLPVSLLAGRSVAMTRLHRLGVFCVDPQRIMIAGKIRIACFDKTGTLTQEGLDFVGFELVAPAAGTGDGGGRGGGTVTTTTATAATTAGGGEDGWEPLRLPFEPLALPVLARAALASCHSVSTLRGGADGELVGLQVEVRMLGATRWTLSEPPGGVPTVCGDGETASLLRRFDFSHETMTMSVVARLGDGTAAVFAKGAPEKIGALCARSSLPADFEARAAAHALDGCYVLALAWRRLAPSVTDADVGTLSRGEAERDLQLMGLLLFRNELKPDTAGAIGDLKQGGVRPVMITGDNAHCAHYIARQCGLARPGSRLLLASLPKGGKDDGKDATDATDGDAVEWSDLGRDAALGEAPPPLSTAEVEKLLLHAALPPPNQTLVQQVKPTEKTSLLAAAAPAGGGGGGGASGGGVVELAVRDSATLAALRRSGAMRRLLMHTRIWARTSPADKMAVVRMFQDEGLVVAMVGDGGNDCGALRAAHAGLALSEAEASLCAAFTTGTKSIVALVDLTRHGRAALATAIATYKFLVVYGQLFSLLNLPLYYYGVDFSNARYLLIDTVAAPALTAAMAFSEPLRRLVDRRPTASLLGAQTVASVVLVLAINALFMAAQLALMVGDPDYVPFPAEFAAQHDWWITGDNWESTVVFTALFVPFVAAAAIYSLGSHFRRPALRNPWLASTSTALVVVASLLVLLPPCYFTKAFHVASEQYNTPCPADCYPDDEPVDSFDFDYARDGCSTCPANPVWLAYQQPEPYGAGGAPSAGMSLGFRVRMLALAFADSVVMLLVEGYLVQTGRLTQNRSRRPNKVRVDV